jgi:hypothetical protein
MRTIRFLLVAVFAAALLPLPASAQPPYADEAVSPAYRHFLTSPYSFRTYSYLGSGRAWGYDTPLESAHFQATPGYYHEEIGPTGRWSYVVPSRVQGYVVQRAPAVYAPLWPAPYPYPPLP